VAKTGEPPAVFPPAQARARLALRGGRPVGFLRVARGGFGSCGGKGGRQAQRHGGTVGLAKYLVYTIG